MWPMWWFATTGGRNLSVAGNPELGTFIRSALQTFSGPGGNLRRGAGAVLSWTTKTLAIMVRLPPGAD